MNFSLQRIKKYLPHSFRGQHSLPDTALTHPVREWNIGITVGACLFLCSVIGAWFVYSYYGTINIDARTESVEVFNYKRSDVLAALERFASREEKYQQLLGAAPIVETVQVEVAPEVVTEQELIEQGLLGTDGQILPQSPDADIDPALPLYANQCRNQRCPVTCAQ